MNDQILQNLDGLSEKEKKAVLQILQEYASNGSSDTFDNLKYQDYKEIPVDIMTFIADRRYLGNSWLDDENNLKLYPYWQKRLIELFPDPFTTEYNDAIFTGSRGIGKSEVAITISLYLMHRVMCLRKPNKFFGLKETDTISFAFMNITKELTEKIGAQKFQATVRLSPWFCERGVFRGRDNQEWVPPEPIKIILGSQPNHVVGQAIFFCFFDEISFIKNKDVEKQRKIALDMLATALGGSKTRFLYNGKNPTLTILASSARSESSFLETYMRKRMDTDGVRTFIVSEPLWNIKPSSSYSGKKFKVALGNKFLSSDIVKENQDELTLIKKGYKIIEVPIELYSDFTQDIDRALCDFGGIASSNLTKYISATRVNDATVAEYQNPFEKDILEIGNSQTDKQEYYDYFDLNKIPSKLKGKPLFIHLDMSVSGDNTGIFGTWIAGMVPPSKEKPDSTELRFQAAFGVSIKAPKGYQISFAKTRNFIYWLREKGFQIAGISSDTYQNAAIAQDLIASGFNYKIISVDRCNQDKICEPYLFLKNAIYDGRIHLFESKLLLQELTELERNGNNGRIDHPDNGAFGSKDMADALCGSLWNASQHAEEYAYYYGEDDISMMKESQMDNKSYNSYSADFEEELRNMFNNSQLMGKTDEEKHEMMDEERIKRIRDIRNGILVW